MTTNKQQSYNLLTNTSKRTYALAILMTMLFMGEAKTDEERFFIIPDDSFYGGVITLIDLKDSYAYQKEYEGNSGLIKFRLHKGSSDLLVSFTDNSRCHTISEHFYDLKNKVSKTQNYLAICGTSTKVPTDNGFGSFQIVKFSLAYAGYYKWDVNDLERAILKE